MNLYPFDADPGGPLAPHEWTVELGSNGAGSEFYYFVNVFRAGEHMCRLAAMGRPMWTEEEARRVLVVKARFWIAEYLGRSPSSAPRSVEVERED